MHQYAWCNSDVTTVTIFLAMQMDACLGMIEGGVLWTECNGCMPGDDRWWCALDGVHFDLKC